MTCIENNKEEEEEDLRYARATADGHRMNVAACITPCIACASSHTQYGPSPTQYGPSWCAMLSVGWAMLRLWCGVVWCVVCGETWPFRQAGEGQI